MCNLIADVNNRPKNTPRSKYRFGIINTMEYDVNSYQVKNTIEKCTRYYKKD